MLAGAAPALLTLFISLLGAGIGALEGVRARTAHAQPLARDLRRPRCRSTTLLAIALASVALIGTWGSVQWLPLWADQVDRRARFPAAKALDACSRSPSAPSSAVCIGPLVGGWMGRRPAYFGLVPGLAGLAARCSSASSHELRRRLSWSWSFVVGGVTAAFYGWLPLYLPELFPTRVRATGQGLSYNFGRILAAVGALTQGQLVRCIRRQLRQGGRGRHAGLSGRHGRHLAGPETKGKPLPE